MENSQSEPTVEVGVQIDALFDIHTLTRTPGPDAALVTLSKGVAEEMFRIQALWLAMQLFLSQTLASAANE